MLIKIIFLVCFLPISLILYFVLRNESKPKKNLILGVTLSFDARQDAAVQAIISKFLMQQNIILAVLILLILASFILNQDSAIMLWDFIWIILAVILPNIPFITANKKLKVLKQKNNWFGESTGVALVDVGLAAAPKKTLSVWIFIPTIVITLIPVVHTVITRQGLDEFWPLLIVYLTFAVLSVGFYFMYRIIFHQKAEVIGENAAVNASLTQMRRYNWGKSWIIIAWLTAVFDFIFWLTGFNTAAILILTVSYSVVLLILVMRVEFKTRKMQQKLSESSGKAVYTDDDDKWLLGMFYNNPNDSHYLINKRTGVGTTMNLAKAPGKILIVFTVLIFLSMPCIGIWMMREESASVNLEVTDTQLIASHTGTVYKLNLADVRSVGLLEKLPSGTRTNGTAMDTVLKGSFRFDGIGSCRVCLDPQVPPFLVIAAADHTYIFGSADKGKTLSVYQTLLNRHVAVLAP
jgi:hypothetical protein